MWVWLGIALAGEPCTGWDVTVSVRGPVVTLGDDVVHTQRRAERHAFEEALAACGSYAHWQHWERYERARLKMRWRLLFAAGTVALPPVSLAYLGVGLASRREVASRAEELALAYSRPSGRTPGFVVEEWQLEERRLRAFNAKAPVAGVLLTVDVALVAGLVVFFVKLPQLLEDVAEALGRAIDELFEEPTETASTTYRARPPGPAPLGLRVRW